MSLTKDEEAKVIELLAHIYAQVPWGKMRTRVNPWDIYNHRVRAAARQGTLYKFASKLANYFGLQHLTPAAIRCLEILRNRETAVLNAIYTEHIPLCMLAIQLAKSWRTTSKIENEEEN